MADLQQGDAQGDAQASESRAQAFSGGVTGGGGVSIASALPRVQQANPEFNASASALMIPNSMRTINGVSDSSYMNQMLPYANKNSPMAKAQQEAGK